MATIYHQAAAETTAILDRVLEKYPDLKAVSADIGLRFAEKESKDSEAEAAADREPCLKVNGYPATATTRVHSYSNRVDGTPDATITVDLAAWRELTDRQRQCVLHRELWRLEVCKDKDDTPKYDDRGRPKLRLRLFDVCVMGSAEIAKEYGDDCGDVQAARECVQQMLPWGDDMAGVAAKMEKVTL